MAPQSPLTVTPPSPTPPTNFSFTGTTAPNPPNYSKNLYTDYADNTTINTPANNPFYDDGVAGALTAFAVNLAALTQGVGSGGTAGGTDGSYPGAANGVVPAATSVPHEGAGTEVVVTNTYTTGTSGTGSGAIGVSAAPPLQMVSCLGNYTTTPNASHASSQDTAPAAAPTITGLLPAAPTATGGDTVLTVNGTNFRNGAVVNLAGEPQQTTYVSPTQLKVNKAAKRTTAGTTAVTVRVGSTTTAATNWTFT
jgi:hypothetical protein